MTGDRPGYPTAKLYNRIVTWARRLARLSLGPGLELSWTRAGRSISRSDPPASFHARLSGGSGTLASPSRFRRVRLLPDGTWGDITAADDRAVAYQANLQDTPAPRIVLMREVGLGGEYRYFRPRYGVSTGCSLVSIEVTVSGCGCPIPGATARLLHGGAQVGPDVATDTFGAAAWERSDFPAIAEDAADFSVHVEAPLYQAQDFDLDPLACGINSHDFDLLPISGYACNPCCPGIPAPVALLYNGSPVDASGSIDASIAATHVYNFDFLEPCAAATGISPVGMVAFWMACDRLYATLVTCTRTRKVWADRPDIPDELSDQRLTSYRGSIPIARDCLGRLVIEGDFPGDFGLRALSPYGEVGSPISIPFSNLVATLELGDPYGTLQTYYESDQADSSDHFLFEEPPGGPPGPTTLPGTHPTATLRVHVGYPPCPESDPALADPIAGATVEILTYDRGTVLAAGTTNPGGLFAVDLPTGTGYYVRTPSGDCLGSQEVYLPSDCQSSQIFDIYIGLCCTAVCFSAKGVYADQAVTTVALDGAVVTVDEVPILAPVVADSEGNFCLFFYSEHVQFLPDVPGTACRTWRATVRIKKQNYLERCISVDLPCGRTMAQAEADRIDVAAYALSIPPPSLAEVFVHLPADLLSICPDSGCGSPGWFSRGLVPANLAMQIHAEAVWEDESMGGTVWYSVLPDIFDYPILLNLDRALLAGDDPDTESPNGPARRVEYSAAVNGIWYDPTGPAEYVYEWVYVYLTKDGLLARLATASYDPGNPGAASRSSVIPPERPTNPGPTGAWYMDLLMPVPGPTTPAAFCLPANNSFDHFDGAGAGGMGWRWDWETAEFIP